MRLEQLDTSRRLRAVVRANERLTAPASSEDVRELTLSVTGGPFECQPGQSIGVLVPGPHAFGHAEHLRLYTVAAPPALDADGNHQVVICVRRCGYVDRYSGERFHGIASNYLCDAGTRSALTICGPYGTPFTAPVDADADLLLIGLGTGIAPFRAFVRQLYEDSHSWRGRVTLFFGARSGLEMLYMNDRRDDFSRYLDEQTFQAFKALSPRPARDEPAALGGAIDAHREEVWRMLCAPHTHVYLAGLEAVRNMLDATLVDMAGSRQAWQRRKAELVAGGRWVELLY